MFHIILVSCSSNMVGLSYFFVVLSLFLSLSLVISLSFLLLLIDFGLWGFTPL